MRIQLDEANLTNADLQDVDLNEANLEKANLARLLRYFFANDCFVLFYIFKKMPLCTKKIKNNWKV